MSHRKFWIIFSAFVGPKFYLKKDLQRAKQSAQTGAGNQAKGQAEGQFPYQEILTLFHTLALSRSTQFSVASGRSQCPLCESLSPAPKTLPGNPSLLLRYHPLRSSGALYDGIESPPHLAGAPPSILVAGLDPPSRLRPLRRPDPALTGWSRTWPESCPLSPRRTPRSRPPWWWPGWPGRCARAPEARPRSPRCCCRPARPSPGTSRCRWGAGRCSGRRWGPAPRGRSEPATPWSGGCS